jgi:hypothetical protein
MQTFVCADVDRWHSVVEVLMLDPNADVGSSIVPTSASSSPTDGSSLAEDPKRKAKSKDLGCRRCK